MPTVHLHALQAGGALLIDLEVANSHSRPYVSDDISIRKRSSKRSSTALIFRIYLAASKTPAPIANAFLLGITNPTAMHSRFPAHQQIPAMRTSFLAIP